MNNNENNNIQKINDEMRNSQNLNNVQNASEIFPSNPVNENVVAASESTPQVQAPVQEPVEPVVTNPEVPQVTAQEELKSQEQVPSQESFVAGETNSPNDNDPSQTVLTPVVENQAQSIDSTNIQQEQVNTQITNLENEINNQTQSINNDEELLKAYVGKNYDKISKQSFSLPGFFLTGYYLLYRKMYLYFLLLIVGICVLEVVPIVQIVTPLAVCILSGIFVNKLYISKAKKDIDKIKSENPNDNFEDLKIKCEKKGGTTIVPVIILIVVEVLALIFFFLVIFGTLFYGYNKVKDIKTTIEEKQEEYENELPSSKFNGIIMYDTDITISEKYSLTVPSVFSKDELFDNEYSYNYSYSLEEGVFNSCNFTFAKVNGYESASSFANDVYEYYKEDATKELSKDKYSNIDWYNFEYEEYFGTKYYYYFTEKNGEIFLFEYEIERDAQTDCLNYKDQILNSIKSL